MKTRALNWQNPRLGVVCANFRMNYSKFYVILSTRKMKQQRGTSLRWYFYCSDFLGNTRDMACVRTQNAPKNGHESIEIDSTRSTRHHLKRTFASSRTLHSTLIIKYIPSIISLDPTPPTPPASQIVCASDENATVERRHAPRWNNGSNN